MSLTMASLSGHDFFGWFFLKSQSFSITEIPNDTYFLFPDFVNRSIIGKVLSFFGRLFKQIASTEVVNIRFLLTYLLT